MKNGWKGTQKLLMYFEKYFRFLMIDLSSEWSI